METQGVVDRRQVQLKFSGSNDDLAGAYLHLVEVLIQNKTLCNADLYRLAAVTPGLTIQ